MCYHVEIHYTSKSSSRYWAAIWQGEFQMNGSTEEWLIISVWVRQRCLLFPTLFNIFLERVISDAQTDHDWKVNIGGRTITHLRSSNCNDGQNCWVAGIIKASDESLDKSCSRLGIKCVRRNPKLMTNSTNGIQRENKVRGQKLGTVTRVTHHKPIVSDDGSKPKDPWGFHKLL